MTLKDDVINGIIKVEGGYVNNPNDSGGATCFGITEAVARANGYTGLMKDLPRTLAFDIYAKKYWDALNLDSIQALSSNLANELADTGVNCGTGRAATFLQRALNLLNRQGQDYADINVDGSLGRNTILALTAYLAKRGKDTGMVVLLRLVNILQGAYYVQITEGSPKNEDFLYGWVANRVVM